MNTRRVAIIGGNRIPFARANGTYAHASDQDMLTATLDGLVERFSLEGERLGEVVAGAVLKHARDRDLTREAVLGLEARARDARLRRPAGVRDGPGDRDHGRQQDRARPDRRRDRGRRRHGVRRADRRQRGPAPHPARPQPREVAARAGAQLDAAAARADRARGPAATRSRAPASRWASTPPRPRPSGASARAEQDELAAASHVHMAAAYDRGFYDGPDHAVPRARARPEPARRTRRSRSWRSSSRSSAGRDDDRGQLDAADRRRLGGAAGQRGVGGGARPAGAGVRSSTRRRRPSTTSTRAKGC